MEHIIHAERDADQQVNEVHYRRASVHAHAAYVLRHAAHKITGTVGLVKISVQFEVMLEHLIFLIVFNMPAHDNDRLSHQEHEEATYERECKNCNTTKGYHAFIPAI